MSDGGRLEVGLESPKLLILAKNFLFVNGRIGLLWITKKALVLGLFGGVLVYS